MPPSSCGRSQKRSKIKSNRSRPRRRKRNPAGLARRIVRLLTTNRTPQETSSGERTSQNSANRLPSPKQTAGDLRPRRPASVPKRCLLGRGVSRVRRHSCSLRLLSQQGRIVVLNHCRRVAGSTTFATTSQHDRYQQISNNPAGQVTTRYQKQNSQSSHCRVVASRSERSRYRACHGSRWARGNTHNANLARKTARGRMRMQLGTPSRT